MDLSKYKRILAVLVALLLIVAFGCGKSALGAEEEQEETSPQLVAFDADAPVESGLDGADHSGIYDVDGITDENSSGSYDSSTANENTILVQNAGSLALTSADINKTGDAEADFFSGQNAAVAVTTKGQLTLNGSNVTTSALGGYGIFVSGETSTISAADNVVVTSGNSSPALAAVDGGALAFSGGSLATEGSDSPCVLLGGDGSVSLTSVALTAKGSALIQSLSGNNRLTLTGMQLVTDPVIAGGAMLTLTLREGASFTGSLGGSLPARANVDLDETSTLTLTGDTYVTALVNADVTHQNIQSNGFYLYYDSNAPENEYLNGQSYLLPGGGFIAPII